MNEEISELEIPDTDMENASKHVYWKAPRDMELGEGLKIRTPTKLVTAYAQAKLAKGDHSWFVVALEEKLINK